MAKNNKIVETVTYTVGGITFKDRKLAEEYQKTLNSVNVWEITFVPSESFSSFEELETRLGELWQEGSKIKAIKLLRDQYPGCGLAEAKAIMEEWYE
jgi:ribosomal protein L7/L12